MGKTKQHKKPRKKKLKLKLESNSRTLIPLNKDLINITNCDVFTNDSCKAFNDENSASSSKQSLTKSLDKQALIKVQSQHAISVKLSQQLCHRSRPFSCDLPTSNSTPKPRKLLRSSSACPKLSSPSTKFTPLSIDRSCQTSEEFETNLLTEDFGLIRQPSVDQFVSEQNVRASTKRVRQHSSTGTISPVKQQCKRSKSMCQSTYVDEIPSFTRRESTDSVFMTNDMSTIALESTDLKTSSSDVNLRNESSENIGNGTNIATPIKVYAGSLPDSLPDIRKDKKIRLRTLKSFAGCSRKSKSFELKNNVGRKLRRKNQVVDGDVTNVTNNSAASVPETRSQILDSHRHTDSNLSRLGHICNWTGLKVNMVSAITNFLCRTNKSEPLNVVDIGGGKGYLSSLLAMEYNLKVLGIDSNNVNTEGAAKRNRKLEKYWNGISRKDIERISVSESGPKKYKQVTQFVNETVDLKKLVQEHYPSDNISGLCITGLHTCGNLAASSLRLYHNNFDAQAIINVGCCYHLLNEEFLNDEENNQDNYGFPMSEFLRSQKFSLGRNARMLSSQSVDRRVQLIESLNKSLLYRAVLQVILKQQQLDTDLQVGRIGAKCQSFSEYIDKISKKLNLNLNLTSQQLEDMMIKYKKNWLELQSYHTLKMSFAPILELLILLDRYLYLLENKYENSYLVKLFDPVISPRCYAIISLK